MVRAWIGILASLSLATGAVACGSTPPMPKGPPPEYEEHDAGTPIFEGESPKPGAPNPGATKPGVVDNGPPQLPAPPSSATPRAPAPEKR